MLRFACCFGAFRVLAESFLTWKNLPTKLYELSTYSFRFEKRGEVVGLKRLRGFTMPDMHTACTDMEQTLEEFQKQAEIANRTGKDLNVNYEVIFRATEDFYRENQNWMEDIADRIGKPILFEILPERKHYWVCKIDFAAIDYLGRPIENPTVQIDVESGKRFGISYLDEDETEKNPILLHFSPTGSIERVICSLLEKIAIDRDQGKTPMLPIWLSPTQVRLITVGEKHLEYAESLSEHLNLNTIRTDIDDRDESVGKKIRTAGTEWIPYTVVIGDDEVNTGKLEVNIRDTGEKLSMSVESLINRAMSENVGYPTQDLTLPIHLSDRINFQ
jgi:threonyl-tRNA synthetase